MHTILKIVGTNIKNKNLLDSSRVYSNPYKLFQSWYKNFMHSPSPPSIQTSLLLLVTIIVHPSKGLKFNVIVV